MGKEGRDAISQIHCLVYSEYEHISFGAMENFKLKQSIQLTVEGANPVEQQKETTCQRASGSLNKHPTLVPWHSPPGLSSSNIIANVCTASGEEHPHSL